MLRSLCDDGASDQSEVCKESTEEKGEREEKGVKGEKREEGEKRDENRRGGRGETVKTESVRI